MANPDRIQSDYTGNTDSLQKSQSLTRDLDNLQQGIRVDFDQKLNELANLLARFKALVIAPGTQASNDHTVACTDSTVNSTIKAVDIEADPANKLKLVTTETVKPVTAAPVTTRPIYPVETARFETGLYKLNSQLYRFRLELDQEMEFREEPLHIHFREQSELCLVLQTISDRTSEKDSDC